MAYLLVFFGGGLGSVFRFIISGCLVPFNLNVIWSTLTANLIACTIVALLVLSKFFIEHMLLQPFLIIGFCGGLSTFSTWSAENFQLLQSGKYEMFILNVVLSIGMGLLPFILLYRYRQL